MSNLNLWKYFMYMYFYNDKMQRFTKTHCISFLKLVQTKSYINRRTNKQMDMIIYDIYNESKFFFFFIFKQTLLLKEIKII